MKKVIQKYI